MRALAEEHLRRSATTRVGRTPTPPGVSPVLALQRVAGNRAVTHLLQRRLADGPGGCQELDTRASSVEECLRTGEAHPFRSGHSLASVIARAKSETSGHTASVTIQRAPTPDSNPTLRALYTSLMQGSETFRELDSVLSPPHRRVRLADLPGGNAQYNPATHTIYVPVHEPPLRGRRGTRSGPPSPPQRRPAARLRAELLFEMHNARNRGALTRIQQRLLPRGLPANATPTERALAPYRAAAYALAAEWEEWAKGVEFNERTERINSEVGPQVASVFGRKFDTPDQKWFSFRNHLQDQIDRGHTANYDPAANLPGWVGHRIVHFLLAVRGPSLMVTQRELADFRSGRRRSIKSDGANPFTSESLIHAAAPA